MIAHRWHWHTIDRIPLLLAAGIVLLLLNACAAPAPTPPPTVPIPLLLAANSETRVEIVPGNTARAYNFAAAQVRLDSRTPGFAFNAEIRSPAGQMVAAFANLQQDVQLTVPPDAGLYQITVAAVNPQQAGTVALALGSAIHAPPTLDGSAYRAADCRVTNSGEVNTLIRSAPAARYAVLALFPPGSSLPALGQTDNGWYTVSFAERQGWVAREVSTLTGDCAALPVVRNPAIPSAAADAQAFLLQADRDGSGVFRNEISAPDGDTSDLIWARVINLDSSPPNNYREFALTLDCTGEGSEFLRWGSPANPSLTCGASIVLPFLGSSNQHPISIVLPSGSRQSYVEYALNLLPANVVG